ncbi:hypothetical protein HYS99_00650 [Candidatus Giovannonibacteria bacterium]|nr:hypothetical protein [Candidatus Giovannonibacteria bacterium]
MPIDLDYLKKQLLDEKTKIEGELSVIASRNPEAPEDWNVKFPDMNVEQADKNEAADQEEEMENRVSIEAGLEARLRDINEALQKMNDGKYGKCTIGGEEIDEARLRANPAAVNCIEHSS